MKEQFIYLTTLIEWPCLPHVLRLFNQSLKQFVQVKVVILGQDPYHGPGQAHGMCFSVRMGVDPPPSLLNIYKELGTDLDVFRHPNHGYLMGWARQGVLLLNACLTVRHKEPKSHSDKVHLAHILSSCSHPTYHVACVSAGMGKVDRCCSALVEQQGKRGGIHPLG